MKEYLKGSVFDRDFMQTKVTSNRVTAKERLFGYIIGRVWCTCITVWCWD